MIKNLFIGALKALLTKTFIKKVIKDLITHLVEKSETKVDDKYLKNILDIIDKV